MRRIDFQSLYTALFDVLFDDQMINRAIFPTPAPHKRKYKIYRPTSSISSQAYLPALLCAGSPSMTTLMLPISPTTQPPPTPDGDLQTSIINAYDAAYKTVDLSRNQRRADDICEFTIFSFAAALRSCDWGSVSSLDDFYKANEAVITAAAVGISSMDSKSLENAINAFGETANIVMQGLSILADIHPLITGELNVQFDRVHMV